MLALDGGANSTLLVGIGDSDSIGIPEDSGTDTVQVTAARYPTFAKTSYTFTGISIAAETVIGTVTAADDDPIVYSLSGTDAANFAIDANGEITVAVQLTYSETYNFNVVATAGTEVTSVPVAVTTIPPPPPSPPVFAETSYAFPDTLIAAGTVIATVAATDDDPLTYSLSGTDAAKFSIDANGEITVAEMLAYSTTYTFNVVANDGTITAFVPVSITTIAPPPPPPATPTDLTVELTATTALLKWVGVGPDIERYEVNYTEGSSLGRRGSQQIARGPVFW